MTQPNAPNNVVGGVRRRWQVIRGLEKVGGTVTIELSCGHEIECVAPEPVKGNQTFVCPTCRSRRDCA